MPTPRRTAGSGEPVHIPVLLRETMKALELQPGLTVVDGTVGAGGHSREILKQIGPQGRLIGLDRDPQMLARAGPRLNQPNCHLVHASHAELREVLANLQIAAVDRVLLDLGLSSDQLADETRGFSFQSEGPLDLRFDTSQGEPAWRLLARLDRNELAELLGDYGEEQHARKIADAIVQQNRRQPVRTAQDLAGLVEQGIGGRRGAKSRHPATQVFQALRIAVNRELEHVTQTLTEVLPACLKAAGVAVVISFHSLEDRLVKHAFRDERLWQNQTPRPITPSPAEERLNPRCRTARLRAARRTENPL